ncbi:NACHT domain-containing protein [Crossiella cryophila]|uniref:NACHT domain-containing protein n=1 Tax=Crossiella cryophila TaxID=43355 RepID=A0A7W7FXL3_9PSEU|nr:NACHT domain-containing protein [Crossiella cryophila]MBB4680768.1 hypothetical protein [Crossiella cryophila]
MTGIETSLLRVATQAVIQVIRPLLPDLKARKHRFAELSELVTATGGDFLARRKVREQLERMITDVFERFPLQEFRHLPEAEVTAALAADGEALSTHDLTDETLFDTDLDHRKLARSVRNRTNRPDGLSADGEIVYTRLLDIACLCLVRMVIQLDPFQPRAALELLSRLTALADNVNRILDRLPFTSLDAPEGAEQDEDFRFRYLELITSTMDSLDLLGVPVSQRSSVRLSVAYLNLRADDGDEDRLSKILGTHRRTFIRGEAGCGKSTLLRWLAVTAAGGRFAEELADWNGRVPLLIKLRSFAEADRLPRPDEFFARETDPLYQLLPAGWVHRQLLSGQALMLVDGVDELPHGRREQVRTWLRGLTRAYPDVCYVITSRPAAAAQDWLDEEEFCSASVRPMGSQEVQEFVLRWHKAIKGRASCADEDLPAFQMELLQRLSVHEHLRALATSPLLCAMLCALNLDRETQLPKDRNSLYQAALEMLLVNRDQSRNIRSELDDLLDLQAKQTLLQRLAWHLTLNELSEMDREQVEEKFAETARAMIRLTGKNLSGKIILDYLLERSGMIREPMLGRIDFVHLTLQEFLAAKEIVEENHIPRLVKEAHEPSWREVVLMTPGQATGPQRATLFDGLLDRAEREPPEIARRLRLLVLMAMANPRPIQQELRRRIEKVAAELLPPASSDEVLGLAAAGEWLLDFLPDRIESLPGIVAASSVQVIAMIGGPKAQRMLSGYATDSRKSIQRDLLAAWRSFDPGPYARDVLAEAPLHPGWIVIRDAELVPYLPLLQGLRRLMLWFGAAQVDELPGLPRLTGLGLGRNSKIDLNRLVELFPALDTLELHNVSEIEHLSTLARLHKLEVLALGGGCTGEDLRSLAELPALRLLHIREVTADTDLSPLLELPRLETLRTNNTYGQVDFTSLRDRGVKVREDSPPRR